MCSPEPAPEETAIWLTGHGPVNDGATALTGSTDADCTPADPRPQITKGRMVILERGSDNAANAELDAWSEVLAVPRDLLIDE